MQLQANIVILPWPKLARCKLYICVQNQWPKDAIIAMQ